jgi:signal transduction histidine kinase
VSTAVRAARLDVQSRLADDLAHEIKNPLNAVVINLAVLRSRVQKGDSRGGLERADIVEREVLRAHELIDRLLRLARPAADEPTDQAVHAVLADVVPLLALQARLARVDFQVEAPADGERVVARPATLRAALLALGGDAIAAAPPGQEEQQVRLRCAVEGGRVSFTVAGPRGRPAADTAAVLATAAGGRLDEARDEGPDRTVWTLDIPGPGA